MPSWSRTPRQRCAQAVTYGRPVYSNVASYPQRPE